MKKGIKTKYSKPYTPNRIIWLPMKKYICFWIVSNAFNPPVIDWKDCKSYTDAKKIMLEKLRDEKCAWIHEESTSLEMEFYPFSASKGIIYDQDYMDKIGKPV